MGTMAGGPPTGPPQPCPMPCRGPWIWACKCPLPWSAPLPACHLVHSSKWLASWHHGKCNWSMLLLSLSCASHELPVSVEKMSALPCIRCQALMKQVGISAVSLQHQFQRRGRCTRTCKHMLQHQVQGGAVCMQEAAFSTHTQELHLGK